LGIEIAHSDESGIGIHGIETEKTLVIEQHIPGDELK
jgi:hypothetical protein